MNPSIFIQCSRIDLGTEFLRFADYPEVRAVHDGTAWNPVELMMWLIALEPSPDTVALSKVNT